MSPLTHNAVRSLQASEGHSANPNFVPTVQIIHVKPVGSNQERFRVIISDGEHFVQGMLATQLNHLVHNNQITTNTVIRVDDYMNNLVQGRTVIILLKIEVMGSNPGSKIGNPSNIEESIPSVPSGNQQPPRAQPMYGQKQQGAAELPQQQNMYNRPPQGGIKSEGGGNPYGGGGAAQHQNTYNGGNRFGGGEGGSAPVVRGGMAANGQPITPIAGLNMYMNRWTIKARVTSKSDIKTWSNTKGEGQLFSVELLDSSGCDIRATFFKEAVDKFYHMLEVDKVYSLSGGRLKVANMQWNTCKSQFEITFDQNSVIQLESDAGDIQQQLYEFRKIAEIENIEPGQTIDVLAIVKECTPPSTIISKKTGKELTKCEMVIGDDSGVDIRITLWGEQANTAQNVYGGFPVVAFKKARIGDYGGRSLSAGNSITVNPRFPETDRLRSWYQSVGSTGPARSLSSSGGGAGRFPEFSERKPLSAIKNENLGRNDDKPDYISFKGTFNFLKKDKEGGAWYTACANSGEPCKNRFKATQTADGNWHCEKCGQTHEKCVRRFIFSATVCDDTCTSWVSVFNEQAEKMFAGVTADEVYGKCFDEGNYDEDLYNSYFAKANYMDWVFTCRVKTEVVNDEARVKTNVVGMHKVDYVKESRFMLDAIAAM